MPDSTRDLAVRLLAQAGINASAADVQALTTLLGFELPRAAPRLATEPQLIQATARWQ
jgi:hypothetical protein